MGVCGNRGYIGGIGIKELNGCATFMGIPLSNVFIKETKDE